MKNIQVFDKALFESDAEAFMNLSCDDKKEWIKKNTNQQDDTIIDEFIAAVRIGHDECKGCKDKKRDQPETTQKAKAKK